MNRISFLIDGFNLYHSIVEASSVMKASMKWLDFHGLCTSYLHLFGRGATLEEIHYFTALAHHRSQDKVDRHRKLIACLEDTGVLVELGRFKPKDIHCSGCHRSTRHYEEKETDVAISVRVIELLLLDRCDTVVLMTGDTDIAPAVRTTRRLFPNKRICFAFPFGRKNKELAKLATDHCFTMSAQSYASNQFPDPVVLKDGSVVHKPPTW